MTRIATDEELKFQERQKRLNTIHRNMMLKCDGDDSNCTTGPMFETCGVCMGSGYSNHPDSGEICQTCNGSGASKPRVRVKASSARITWTQYALNYMDPQK